MLRTTTKQKLRLNKNTVFLGLIKKYRTHEFTHAKIEVKNNQKLITFAFFKKFYTPLFKLFYIFDSLDSWSKRTFFVYKPHYLVLNYYATANTYMNLVRTDITTEWTKNNMIIFSRPKKQLFLMVYKSKPTFIFTGGLMRIVMNEKRKSSKKMYKVAISLIKLSTILLLKRNYVNNGSLRLINVGQLRIKILQSFSKSINSSKILYVFIIFRRDFTSQKFETRRAIKKYVKKRFKLN